MDGLVKLTFTEYAEAVREALGELTEGSVELHEVVKNNGKRVQAVTILESSMTNVSPTIYLKEYYDEYMERGFTESVYSILNVYQKNKVNGHIDFQFLDSYENIKAGILPRLINYKKNMEMLEHTPHIRYFDLAVVFHYLMADDDGQYAGILVTDELNGKWWKTAGELYEDSLKNMEQNIYMNPLFDELNMLTGHEIQKEEGLDGSVYGMYVLSNSARFYGASAMLSGQALRRSAEEMGCGSFIILPSSVHEVLLLPKEADNSMEGLRSMVGEINRSGVIRTEDFLSDSIYVYDAGTGDIHAI